MSAAPENLVDVFRELGVSEPQEWAHSEVSEGIDQTARATLLRALADSTIEACSAESWRRSAGSSARALNKLIEQGADLEAVKELCVQSAYTVVWEFLRMSSGMDDPKLNPGNVAWAIMRVDSGGNPVGEITTPYESWWRVLCAVSGRDEDDI
jgi:hypothetical protein